MDLLWNPPRAPLSFRIRGGSLDAADLPRVACQRFELSALVRRGGAKP